MTVERARWAYELATQLARVSMAWGCPGPCPACEYDSLQVDAASLAYDNAVALHWAGRYPRLASRREIAWA